MLLNLQNTYSLALNATNIVKQFIEEYHQVLEEEYIFPVLYEHKKYKRLIEILRKQYDAAKCVTDKILTILGVNNKIMLYRNQLIIFLTQFVNMYDPHTSREDTVIFPAFHELTPKMNLMH